jgi:hypothetical protein
MKGVLFLSLVIVMVSCQFQNREKLTENNPGAVEENSEVRLILDGKLEQRRQEFMDYLIMAEKNIKRFSEENSWLELAGESVFDSVMIFDDKQKFNITLLKVAKADTTMELPDSYCAALENRTLMAVTPEFYAKVYPQGIEENSYAKLLTHEIAHRLHVRILQGNEEAMGPVWFYEGFALFAADQFVHSVVKLDKKEMLELMTNPERGNYEKYNFIFRYFANKLSLHELISKAKDENFNAWLISQID